MNSPKHLMACLIATVACLATLAIGWGWPRGRAEPQTCLYGPPAEGVEILRRRTVAREQVIDRLLEGQMRLVEAAAWFRRFNENPPEHRVNYRHWPGDSDGERLCRQVLDWVSGRLQSRGMQGQLEAVLGTLKAELTRLLEADGTIELPW
jgi:hypothetical protein